MRTYEKLGFLIFLMFVAFNASAEGTNIFAGLTDDVFKTVEGSKGILYLAEGVSACIAYAATKKMTVFIGVGIVMIYLNWVLGKANIGAPAWAITANISHAT